VLNAIADADAGAGLKKQREMLSERYRLFPQKGLPFGEGGKEEEGGGIRWESNAMGWFPGLGDLLKLSSRIKYGTDNLSHALSVSL